MNAFEHQLAILNALAARKKVQCCRIVKSAADGPREWIDVAREPHMLDFTSREYRIAPPGVEPVYAVWDNESGLYVNKIFHGPAAATNYAISSNAAIRSENRFVPVKLQRVDDGA